MPAPEGVNTPLDVIVPPVALHVTFLLKAPVPLTFARQVAVCEVLIDDGFAITAMPVTVTEVGAADIPIEAVAYLVLSCVDVAVQVPVPTPEGVNTPPDVIVPPVALHVTFLLKAPVPLTFARQVAVCEVLIDDGFAITAMPVTVTEVGAADIPIEAVAYLVLSCVDVAVQVPVPTPEGMNTPLDVIVPPVALHVTASL